MTLTGMNVDNAEPNKPDPTGRTLLVCCGLPRSGKTTWCQAQPHPIVCPDAVRYAVHGQRFLSHAEPLVWGVVKTMVRALFNTGHKTVVVDATNGTRRRRAEWLSSDWGVWYVPFSAPAEVCVERARAMNDEYIVPVIERMAAEWEPLGNEEPIWVGDK